MDFSKETSEKIDEIQMIERNSQSMLAQKQAHQLELNEVSNALGEVKSSKDEVYKVLGNVMIKTNKESIIKELEERKKILEIRVNSIEKQEKLLEDRAEKLKEEISKELKKKDTSKQDKKD